jgi:uridine phosphorylase
MLKTMFIPSTQGKERSMAKQYHIHLEGGDCAPYVLLPGDPGRVHKIAEVWDTSRKVAQNREYVTYTGVYKGMPITCTSTGIGGASTAIALEELARVGARVFLRIGTCGTFQDHVKDGDMIIFDSALRLDGASQAYAPPAYPAVADYQVVAACVGAAKALNIPYHVGVTRSHDGLYAGQPAPGGSFNGFWQARWKDDYADFKRLNVLAAEMEASVMMVLAKIWGLRAGGMAVSVINVFNESGDDDYDPSEDFDQSDQNVVNLAKMGSEALYLLSKMDQE